MDRHTGDYEGHQWRRALATAISYGEAQMTRRPRKRNRRVSCEVLETRVPGYWLETRLQDFLWTSIRMALSMHWTSYR